MSHLKDKLNKTLEKCKDNIKSAMNGRCSYDVTNRKQSGQSGSHSRFWKRECVYTEMERCGLISRRHFQDSTERTRHSPNKGHPSNCRKSNKDKYLSSNTPQHKNYSSRNVDSHKKNNEKTKSITDVNSRCSRRASVNFVPTILSNSVRSCCARRNMIMNMELSPNDSPKRSKNLEILKSDEISNEI
ncbi:hypothetical protein HELRODRAFT_178126 [Helobdella robusta]|uniref:Uncharacterized protein n=1 Tax=Helobdella robusta TaxID=6412 RepID=T1FCS6_HELRO|nr:hypothetical protein HELRODRAFT_178126 [Helobdella robusta]ESN97340.1 hypothetical protein HELRODRAFT_178126 [Helobdella robusta]